jgi:hypothetical protein
VFGNQHTYLVLMNCASSRMTRNHCIWASSPLEGEEVRICMGHSRNKLPMLCQPIVFVLFLNLPANLVFRTDSPVACDDDLLKHEKFDP